MRELRDSWKDVEHIIEPEDSLEYRFWERAERWREAKVRINGQGIQAVDTIQTSDLVLSSLYLASRTKESLSELSLLVYRQVQDSAAFLRFQKNPDPAGVPGHIRHFHQELSHLIYKQEYHLRDHLHLRAQLLFSRARLGLIAHDLKFTRGSIRTIRDARHCNDRLDNDFGRDCCLALEAELWHHLGKIVYDTFGHHRRQDRYPYRSYTRRAADRLEETLANYCTHLRRRRKRLLRAVEFDLRASHYFQWELHEIIVASDSNTKDDLQKLWDALKYQSEVYYSKRHRKYFCQRLWYSIRCVNERKNRTLAKQVERFFEAIKPETAFSDHTLRQRFRTLRSAFRYFLQNGEHKYIQRHQDSPYPPRLSPAWRLPGNAEIRATLRERMADNFRAVHNNMSEIQNSSLTADRYKQELS